MSVILPVVRLQAASVCSSALNLLSSQQFVVETTVAEFEGSVQLNFRSYLSLAVVALYVPPKVWPQSPLKGPWKKTLAAPAYRAGEIGARDARQMPFVCSDVSVAAASAPQ